MKKIMKLFVLVAAAAMALVSCQKNEIDGPVNKEVHFTIKADFEETKTAITDNGDKTYTPTWANGDKIGVLFALEEDAQAVEFANTADAGETATFEGKHAFTVVEGASEVSGNLYAFYPSSAFEKEKTVYTNGEIRLDLNVRQNPTSTSFDPSCDLMIAKPCYYVAEATGESVEVHVDDMYFARMMSVLRINLNSTQLSNETVKSVSFDAEGLDLTGAMRFNLETGKFVGNLSTSQDLSEVTAVYSEEDPIYVAGEKNSAYLVVAPVTIPSGTTLTFTIETENYDIVKTVTAPADMVMPAGNIAVINLTISEDDCAAKDNSDYSGTYIVVAKKSDIYYYMSTLKDGGLSGNNRTAISSGVSEITDYTSSKTDFAGVEETCVWNVAKVDGGYTFANMDNTNYLYTTDANRAMMGTVGQASIFTISVENNIYTITDNVYYRTLSLNTSSDLFACYASGQNPELTLIPYVADTTPRITVEDTEYNVSADDETLEFGYTTKNIDGTPTVSVANGATMTSVEALAENGTVTVIFDANAEEVEKTATLVLSYEGAESVYVTITQAAKAAEGGESGWISTPFADLKEGDQVVIVSTKNTSTWAMSNDNGTGAAPTGVTGVTYANGKLTVEPAENIIWYVGVDGNNRIFYKDSGKATWLYCTADNNGVRVGTNANKAFTFESNYLKNVGTSRYVGVYTTNPDWRCYTSINTNIEGQTFQFFVKSGDGEVVTPEPTPDPGEPETPSTKTATITFGSSGVKINSASVTGDDSEGNTWTITTVGTTSFTSNSAYYQVGSSSKPATSITFSTTLPANASVSNISAKFGGFNGTAGTVTLKVGDTSVGAGSLNATSDVTVNSTSTATGNVVTVTVTGISKGVKCYNISVTYTE